MLNELYHLSMVLEQTGIKPYDWDFDFEKLPNVTDKNPCYRIILNEFGHVSDVELIANKLGCILRKWEPSNGNSFPGFNILPIYKITTNEDKKILIQWRSGKVATDVTLLKTWCANLKNNNWNKAIIDKLTRCLHKIPEELKALIILPVPSQYSALERIIERSIKTSIAEFKKGIESCIIKKIENRENYKQLLPLLIHDEPSTKLSVFLDVPDWSQYPVAHENTIKWLNECLVQYSNSQSCVKKNDAFANLSGGFNEKMPSVKVKNLGNVTLRAMTSESPCQYRYNTIDASSFVIGLTNRRKVKGSLEWLGDNSREGETWGCADAKELIFAYPTIIPKSLPKLAACFGARKVDDREERFANYANDVVECLRGLAPMLKDVELRVFSLRKMDTARTKIVFNRNYTAQRLVDASNEWQQGCDNIPEIQMRVWGEEKGNWIIAKPKTPFPLQIAECLNNVWKVDSKTKDLFQDKVKVLAKTTGIELLLDESVARRQVPHLLAVALNNSKTLFTFLGNSLHRDEILKNNGNYQYMPAILGLLLWKIGIRKEHYMNNSSYLVGRILKVADELHALYCKELRKNKLPPQLLGNALMTAALETPTQALAQLALRIAPYLGWAKTNSTDSAGLSRKFLKEFGEIEVIMRNETLPNRLNDAERAQMLLGYISGNPQTTSTNNN